MARVPSRRELESMLPHNACKILEVHANECLQLVERYGHQSHGSSFFVNADIERECGKLYRIYKLANELGHYVGQPDYEEENRRAA